MNNVAIVGRPNVGKSALFNRLAKRRIAIVHDQPGITRDRICANVEVNGKAFTLWDTGGIIGAGETQLSSDVRAEAERAIAESALILFVVDAQDGVNPLDRVVARLLRRMRKPVLLVVNKIDDAKHENLADEFSALGFDHIFPLSAAHGRGIAELTNAIATTLPDSSQPLNSSTSQPLRLAVVGRPNAGKSSLINALLKDRRTIVSEIPGTTRDAVDVEYEREGRRYLFIDTAGIRARSKHSSSVEVFSVMRAEKTIERADLCLLVIDASDGVRAQDRRIAGLIQKARKSCIVVLNKWDLVSQAPGQRKGTMRQLIDTARAELFFLDYAPLLVTSALTREYASRIFRLIEKVQHASRAHIGTGKLNRLLQAAFARNPPPMISGKRLKLFYAAQAAAAPDRTIAPPEFILFVNSPRLLSEPYARFLEGNIREAEPYPGLPILLTARARTQSHPEPR
ncbi:MAG: ribosome biogenesis GTPase Der [Chthoniobacterales bacterium]|nr:MAG: ribosome biogenesis GTPase Der [Chthoniobacterales bacterium]